MSYPTDQAALWRFRTSSALHVRKDLAVSPERLLARLIRNIDRPKPIDTVDASPISGLASLFAPRRLLWTGVTRYDPARPPLRDYSRETTVHVFGLSSQRRGEP